MFHRKKVFALLHVLDNELYEDELFYYLDKKWIATLKKYGKKNVSKESKTLKLLEAMALEDANRDVICPHGKLASVAGVKKISEESWLLVKQLCPLSTFMNSSSICSDCISDKERLVELKKEQIALRNSLASIFPRLVLKSFQHATFPADAIKFAQRMKTDKFYLIPRVWCLSRFFF